MQRQSNIELLRIVSMFLILVVHVSYFSLGIPTQEMINESPQSSLTHLLFIALSICAVDTFVLISGYFGIKPSFNKTLSLCFIGLFYPIVIAIVFATFLGSNINLARVLYLYPHSGWFLLSYLILYLISPTLNAFIQQASQKELRNMILWFYAFQTIFGWINNSCVEYEDGYSALSFIGIYLLGRYLKLYFGIIKFKKSYTFLIMYLFLGA